MMNHEKVTRIREDERLAELEKTIAKGRKTFVDVGMALAEIRDLRLYKREYGGFEEYCRKKWGWSKPYCTQLITAAAVVESLPADKKVAIATESQARELAKAAPADRAGVVAAVVGSGKPVTAAAIRQHLPPPPMVRRGTNGTDGGAACQESRAPSTQPSPPAGERESAPAKVRDKIGREIPECCLEIWNRAQEAQEHLTAISRIRGTLRKAQDNQDRLYAEICFSGAMSYLDQAFTELKTALPYTVCPSCQGHLAKTCRLCKGRGMISEYRWDTCVAEETKRIIRNAEKLKG